MLEVEGLTAGYGPRPVLREASLEVRQGEVVVLLGANGAGKSTLLKSVMRLIRPRAGRVCFAGHDISRAEPFQIARLGLGYVPEDRRIFGELTVAENLDVGRQPPRSGAPAWTRERIHALFPPLAALDSRPGARMSGGEQKMLAIARTLMGNPAALLLDEPSEGIAPVIVRQMADTIRALKGEGLSVLLCEQNVAFDRRVADRAYVIENGVVGEGTLS